MSILKCKSCGGTLDGNVASTIATCPFCGSKQMLPMIESDKPNVALLERAFLFLEDGDFSRADQYFENVLDNEPTNAYAYLGKLMSDLEIKSQKEFEYSEISFVDNDNYKKVLRFGNKELVSQMQQYNQLIENRIKENKNSCTYNEALKLINGDSLDSVNKGITKFESLGDYKDSKEQINIAKQKRDKYEARRLEAEAEKIRKEKRTKKLKKLAIIATAVVAIVIVVLIVLNDVIIPDSKYNKAVALMNEGKYEEAITAFEELDGYKDSEDLRKESLTNMNAKTISSGGNHTVAVKYNGTVIATDGDSYADCAVEDWTDIVAVSAGYFHTVGLKSDGTVVAINDNGRDECDVEDWTDIVAVSAGLNYTVGLKSDGTVVATGDNEDGQCDVEGWTGIVAISAGWNHTVGLKSDGTVVATKITHDWADYGQCDVKGWTDIVAVSAGDDHTVGLKSDGTVVATKFTDDWADHGQCDVEEWEDIVAISCGEYNTIGLKSDGTVVATEIVNASAFDYGQCDVEDWTDIVAISAKYYHTVGLKKDGTVVATGNNDFGECDLGGWTDIKVPVNK